MDMLDKYKPCTCDLLPCTCGSLDEVNIKELLKFLDNKKVQEKIINIIVNSINDGECPIEPQINYVN